MSVSSVLKHGPILSTEFAGVMRQISLRSKEKIGVAVSGGADSLALCVLLQKYFGSNRIEAYTVDHKLRPESTQEARLVTEKLKGLGINSKILTIDWTSTPTSQRPTSAQLETLAREERFKLLSDACQKDRIRSLFLGHHLNDQIETSVFRLTRASGIEGLGGMKIVSEVPVKKDPWSTEMELIRPLLGFPKDRLLDTCKHHDIDWIEDPSNSEHKHQRNQIRSILNDIDDNIKEQPQLKPLSFDSLAGFSQRMSQHRAEIQNQVINHLKQYALHDEPTGTAFLRVDIRNPQHSYFLTKPHLSHRILSAIIQWAGGNDYAPSLPTIIRLRIDMLNHLLHQTEFRTQCVGNAIIIAPRPTRTGASNWIVSRQPAQRSVVRNERTKVSVGDTILFDNRFFVSTFPPQETNPAISTARQSTKESTSLAKKANKTKSQHTLSFIPSSLDNWDMIVRFLSEDDLIVLKKVINRDTSYTNPIWYRYRRAIWHYVQKMPFQSRCTIPVVSLIPKLSGDKQTMEGSGDLSATKSDDRASVTDASSELEKATALWGNCAVDRIVALPSLGVNLIPQFAEFSLSHKDNPLQIASSSVGGQSTKLGKK
ncbi:PP-loop family-domain-containing protein [Paraphysoderma sedebokerense]|nr:PP-loop family-domain-containing protein [Paraphysoderma sedebokerense]